MIYIHRATSQSDLDATRTLMRAYVECVRAASPEDKEKDDLYFDHAAFEKDLAGLPGKYDGPKGSLLIAYYDGQPVGCVASQEMDDEFCEMKRMFVSPESHGLGIGRALANRVISEAVGSGYRGIRLDTTRSLKQAVSLYESLGFREVSAYCEIPPELVGWLVFYELKFAAS